MTLGFSTKIKGIPTYFVEKIWEGIFQKGIEINANEFIEYGRKSLPEHYKVGSHIPKIHTIRQDSSNRWKVGNDIHFVIGNRTKHRLQFAPIVKVKSTQRIEILHGLKRDNQAFVSVDGKTLHISEIEKLSINDGFDSVDDFFSWFNEDFSGKIIHWTDFKY